MGASVWIRTASEQQFQAKWCLDIGDSVVAKLGGTHPPEIEIPCAPSCLPATPTPGCPTHHQSPMMLAGQRRMKKSPSWVREKGSILPGLRKASNSLHATRREPGTPEVRRGPGGWVPAVSLHRAGPGWQRHRRGRPGRAGLGWAGTSGRLERGAEAAPEKEEEEGRGCESICSDRETGARGDGQGGPGGGTPGCQAPFLAQSHGHDMGTGTLR